MDAVERGDLVTVNEQLQNALGFFPPIASTNVYSGDKPSEPGVNQTLNVNKGERFSLFEICSAH